VSLLVQQLLRENRGTNEIDRNQCEPRAMKVEEVLERKKERRRSEGKSQEERAKVVTKRKEVLERKDTRKKGPK
jgi:hypothetical protein